MTEITDRDMHLIKKSLAVAVLARERQPGPFQSSSDKCEIKQLLEGFASISSR